MITTHGGGGEGGGGEGNLIASLDFMLRLVLIPRGLINHGGGSDEFKGKDCVFEADWLKTKAYTSCVPYSKVLNNDLYL